MRQSTRARRHSSWVQPGVALVAAALVGTPARADGYPPLFDPEDGCERWVGTSSGNDPSTRIQMLLCPDGDRVRGKVQTASLNSGYSTRALEGAWSAGTLTARDTKILEDRPEPGWMFCTVDTWSLVRTGDQLDGSYDSAACRDHAEVHLQLLEDPKPKPSPDPRPEETETGPAPVDAVPAGVQRKTSRAHRRAAARDEQAADGGCGCAAHNDATPTATLGLGVVVLLWRRRRRP